MKRTGRLGAALVLCVFPVAAIAGVQVKVSPASVKVREGKEKLDFHKLTAADALELVVDGPAQLTVRARPMPQKPGKPPREIELTVLRDGAYRTAGTLDFGAPFGGKKPRGAKAEPTTQLRRIDVPAGQHELRLSYDGATVDALALRVTPATASEDPQPLGVEALLPGAEPPSEGSASPSHVLATASVDAKAIVIRTEATPEPTAPPRAAASTTPVATQSPKEANSGEAAALERELRLRASGVTDGQAPKATNPGGAPAPSAPVPVQLEAADGTVAGASRVLADAMAKAFGERHPGAAFHRVAVPYFSEVGADATDNQLGKVVAELVSVELAKREPFVLVERERLDQVMREHRLKSLGVVDEDTAAEFGKVFGAQSILAGSVSDAGPQYVVAVRQVDVESGQVLVTGQVNIDRAGLIALSSEAVVKKSKLDALFRSTVMPGWGQLYNDEPVKGGLFLAGGLGALGTGLGFYAAALSAQSQYEENTASTVRYRDVANDRIRVANTSLLVAAAVWGLGMLDAYLSGRDYSTVTIEPGPAQVGGAR